MKLRTIQYADENACIADIERLQLGYRNGEVWSLPQVCWHLNAALSHSLKEPAHPEPTAEQREQQAFIDQVITSGWPAGMSSPAEMVPPDDAGSDAITGYIASLRQLRDYQPARVEAFIFGPVTTDKFRQFMLIHTAEHLSFLQPT